MFTVRFYQFTKNENSTAVPSSAAVEFSTCQAKAPISVLSPVISVMNNGAEWNPQSYNYCYIPEFARYYYITDWTNSGPVWSASCRVDVLATYRAQIGAFNTYVYRSSYEFDGRVADSKYPFMADVSTVIDSDVPSPFSIDNADNGFWYLVTVQGGGPALHYVMNQASLVRLLSYVFSDEYYAAVLGNMGATEYPEAKVAINPMQYITSVKLVNGALSTFTDFSSAPVSGVTVGVVYVSPQGFTAYMASPYTYRILYTMPRPNHPQAASRGSWLNSSSSASLYELYMPPFGFVSFDSGDIGLYDTLAFYIIGDGWGGNANLRVTAYNAEHQSDTEHTISDITISVGVSIPISGITLGYTGSTDSGSRFDRMKTNMDIATWGGFLGAALSMSVSSAVSTANNVYNGADSFANTLFSFLTPHASFNGSAGGTLCNCLPLAKFTARFLRLVDEDNRDAGRPLMKNRTIANLPGFVVCNPEHFAIPGYKTELDEICGYMARGFFYV